jgi:hypothetical protein
MTSKIAANPMKLGDKVVAPGKLTLPATHRELEHEPIIVR